MSKKQRIDVLLVEKNFYCSRERAKKALMSGIVYVDEKLVDKPGTKVDEDSKIQIRGKDIPYVSRGGLKLEKAINEFNIDINNKICMDVGASTGGFTDCMLQNGAKKVYAIDVGYGQLHWKLRNDKRVISMERTNIRYVKQEDINDIIDFASIDVSFISLKIVLPVVKKFVKDSGEIVFLIKPQFEAGREKVGKNGVIKDKDIHKEVIEDILNFAIEIGLFIKDITFSPIKGPKGNIEFLAYCTKKPLKTFCDVKMLARKVVEKSHEDLD